jgi:hypothetical protein
MFSWLYNLLLSFVQFVLSFFSLNTTSEKKKVHFDESVKDSPEDNTNTALDTNELSETSS